MTSLREAAPIAGEEKQTVSPETGNSSVLENANTDSMKSEEKEAAEPDEYE